MADNYLNHEDSVKFYENFLNRSKEWQIFIDLIEERFELVDITSWQEFLTQRTTIADVFSYFIKIIECNPSDLIFSNKFFQEVFIVAEFYQGKKERKEVQDEINSNFGKIFLLIVWITKLENQDNGTEYLFDLGLLTQKNMAILLKIDTLCLFEDEILLLFDSINIDGLNDIKNIFVDNINKIIYPIDKNFLESCRDKIIHVNAFHFNRITRPDTITWEENYLLDMLNISFQDRKIIPMFSSGDSTTPNFKQWTESVLEDMQKYFDFDIADFIIETIRFILYKKVPCEKVIDKHIELFVDNSKHATTLYEKYENSSFHIISYLIEDHCMNSEEMRTIMRVLSKIKDVEELKLLNDNKISLNKEQKRILKDYYENCFLKLDSIENDYEYLEYLLNKNNVKFINNEYVQKNAKLFNEYIKKTNNITCASLFINYMLFLTRLGGNSNIDNEYVKSEMIRIQELWENEYFDKCISQLHSIGQTIELKTENIEKFNQEVLDNIFILANCCVITRTEQYIDNMELVSKYPFSSMVSTISLEKYFPINEKMAFDIDKHDIDKLTTKIISNIQEKYRYKFINKLETEVYVKDTHKRMIQNAQFYLNIFNKTKEIYLLVQEKLSNHVHLIDYQDNIQLAHLVQLFPVIEIVIKKIGKVYNIFPFKEDEKYFMQSKDPSSILRLILEKAYDETQSFEVVPDLLYVYHFLYNGNSLNIRNECVHGRDYLSGGSLNFAFKIVLTALYMLIRRLEIIESYRYSENK